jgi:hypothetical protein
MHGPIGKSREHLRAAELGSELGAVRVRGPELERALQIGDGGVGSAEAHCGARRELERLEDPWLVEAICQQDLGGDALGRRAVIA